MKQNRLTITARFAKREPLRYTPTGIPVLNFRLAHRSEQIEAGRPRRVECELPAVAVGPVATQLTKLDPDRECEFSGFLVSRRHFETAELHVVEFIET